MANVGDRIKLRGGSDLALIVKCLLPFYRVLWDNDGQMGLLYEHEFEVVEEVGDQRLAQDTMCDLAGEGRCANGLWRQRGGGLVRCGRHISLQRQWSDIQDQGMDLVDWIASWTEEEQAAICRVVPIDGRYWERAFGGEGK